MVIPLDWMQAGKPVTEEALKDIKAPVLQPAVPGALPGSAAAVARPGASPALQPPIGQPGSLLNPSKALGAAGQLPPHLRAIASAPAQVRGQAILMPYLLRWPGCALSTEAAKPPCLSISFSDQTELVMGSCRALLKA